MDGLVKALHILFPTLIRLGLWLPPKLIGAKLRVLSECVPKAVMINCDGLRFAHPSCLLLLCGLPRCYRIEYCAVSIVSGGVSENSQIAMDYACGYPSCPYYPCWHLILQRHTLRLLAPYTLLLK